MSGCQLQYANCGRQPDQRGFTLIEMMIAISVMAILMAVGLPSMRDALLSMKLSSYANGLVGGVYTARSEAIKRNATITLCASSDGSTCAASGNWEQGWIVMCNTSTTTSNTCNSSGTYTLVLLRQPATGTGFQIKGIDPSTSSIIRSVAFQPTGMGSGQATLTVCRSSPVGQTERVVSISATGRPSVAKTTAGVCS